MRANYMDYFTCIGEEEGDEFFFAYKFVSGTAHPIDSNGNATNDINQAKKFKRLANAWKFADKHEAMAGDTDDFVICTVQLLTYMAGDIVDKEAAYQTFKASM